MARPTRSNPASAVIAHVGIRHRVVLVAVGLWLAAIGYHTVRGGLEEDYATTYLLLILLQATLSVSPRMSTRSQQFYASGALLTANAVLIEAAGRQLYPHLLFIAVLTLLTLFQSWATYLGAVAYLALYYLVFGAAHSDTLFPFVATGYEQWPLTLFAGAVAVSLIGVISWVLHARTQRDSDTLRVRLAEAALREKQARELNDTVVQDLVTTLYAAEEGSPAETARAARAALESARQLVSSLLAAEWVRDETALMRDQPSQHPDQAGGQR